MLIIKQREKDSIDRMLRRYKRKFRDTKVRQEVQRKRFYTKPSDQRRLTIAKAKYSNQKLQEGNL